MRFGDASPMLVTWHFFSLSRLYHDSIGIAQIVTGVLLVFRRTAPIGALCFFVIILNIVLINFGYDIATDVKILRTILLSLNCLLIGHYRQRYRLLLLPETSLDELLESEKRRETSAAEAVQPGPVRPPMPDSPTGRPE
jgi:hypothetical protein